MTKITGKVLVQGTVFNITDNYLTTVGNSGTHTGVTINGGAGPAYSFATDYANYSTDQYGLTATEYVLPWDASPIGFVGSVYDSNHTYRFDPSWSISTVTPQNIFSFAGLGTGPDTAYLEFVINDVAVITAPSTFQVGIETILVPYAGNVPDPQNFYQTYYTNDGAICVYLNGVRITNITNAETYGPGDVIGMVIYRDGSGASEITWFKNANPQPLVDINTNMFFERARVNIGQNALGYSYGPTPPPSPVVSSSGLITMSTVTPSDTYIYQTEYEAVFSGATYISDTFQTGMTYEVYTDGNRTIADLGL